MDVIGKGGKKPQQKIIFEWGMMAKHIKRISTNECYKIRRIQSEYAILCVDIFKASLLVSVKAGFNCEFFALFFVIVPWFD